MFNLRTIAFKLFRAARTQVMTSIVIIAITICLIMTMSVYIWNAKAKMDAEIYALFGDAEMTVGYNPEQQKWITTEQFNTLSNMEGIKNISPVYLTHTNVEDLLPSVYTVGAENDGLVKSRYHFQENLGKSDVMISSKIAAVFQKSVGDTIDIEYTPFTIKEILEPLPGTADTEMIIVSNHTIKQWIDLPDYDNVGLFALMNLEADISSALISDTIRQLDDQLRIDITNEYEFVKANFQALVIFIIVLSVFVLIIASVLLISTFQLVFFKLKEQLMVLRSLGATAKQIGRLVQAQLIIIISLGVVAGTFFSLLVIHKLLPFLIYKMGLPEAPSEFPIGLVVSIALAVFVLLLGTMQWQVWKSTRLLPLQIEEENYDSAPRLTKLKLYLIGTIAACALLILFTSVFETDEGQGALQLLIASLLICLLILYMTPFWFSRILKSALQPIRNLFGKEAYMACNQLMPQVRRNMPIILSIIGLMVILIFGTALFKTIHQNEKNYIDFLYETPVVVQNNLSDPTLTTEVIQEIEALPTVEYAYAKSNYPYIEFDIEGRWQGENFQAIDINKFMETGMIAEINGDVENGVIITEEFAENYSLQIGDSLKPAIFHMEGQQREEMEPVQVIGIIEPQYVNIPVLIDWSSALAKTSDVTVDQIIVQTPDIQQTLAELEFLYDKWPALTFSDIETFTAETDQMFYQRWSLFSGVMVILIVATCLGVIQTLLHAIHGKRNDFAIQRLIGLSPNGLVKLILTQVLSFVLYGLLIGSILGFLFTRLLSFIDSEAMIVFDHTTILLVTGSFLFAIFITFMLQGHWISRKKLAGELEGN